VIEHVQLGGVEVQARGLVAHERVVGEAVPQAGDHLVKLAGAAIALGVLHVLGAPEVFGRVRVGRGDDVPARAPAAQMIERREAARHVIGLVERGRGGGHQTDVLGHDRQRGQQGERLERGDRVAALERLQRHVEHGQVIGHEEGIELRTLQGPGEARQVREVEVGVCIRARVAPGARVNAHRAHERAELQLFTGHHLTLT